jgi:AmmeMemoRadiSam system protein B/AmmeMemoRadiSam system protein A
MIKYQTFVGLLIIMSIFSKKLLYAAEKYQAIKIRKPAVAGKFYSDDETFLKKGLQYFFTDAIKAKVNKPSGIIVPHAGYIFSGQIAADAYNQARDHHYDVVVIMGTNHTTPGFFKISIYPRKGYQTPLGLAEIDEELADELIEMNGKYTFDARVHTHEHSVEVQVPFIQHLFSGVKILPVVIGSADPELCTQFGKDLASVLKDRNALIVASSDLSHYPSCVDARNVDKETLESIVQLDPSFVSSTVAKQMKKPVEGLSTCACGEGPILTLIEAAKLLGANCGTVISYANSGETSFGDKDRVVGYGAVSFSIEKNCKGSDILKENSVKNSSKNLRKSDKKMLLAFARKSIQQYLESETIPLPRGFNHSLNRKQAAFVTLRKHGILRGCIGHMTDNRPLCEVVGAMALQSAFNDMRFNPVKLDELPSIDIEISILTPFKKIKDEHEIVLGRDGVLLKKDNRQAVYLPQVGSETGWGLQEYLEHLCSKAGLPPDGWKDAQLFTFRTEILHEADFL